MEGVLDACSSYAVVSSFLLVTRRMEEIDPRVNPERRTVGDDE